jgi:acetylornithine deacetylase/succinyl-diaminopimelate desuccinylase-like protein
MFIPLHQSSEVLIKMARKGHKNTKHAAWNESESRIISLTEELIRFKSSRNNTAEIEKNAKFIIWYLKRRVKDLDIRIFENNGIKTYYFSNKTPGKAKSPEIMLCGHTDVIPANDSEYNARHDDKYIYGRGSGDMKSGLAVLIELFIKHSGSKNITLLITTDEEVGGPDGAGIAAEKLNPDLVIITEPTDNKILLEEKGGAWIDIDVKSPGGHASRPWVAQNAIDILFEIIQELRKTAKTSSKLGWSNTLSIGAIYGGALDLHKSIQMGAGNIIAKHARARIDMRLTEKTSHASVIKMLDGIVDRRRRALKKIDDTYDVSFKVDHTVDHLITKRSNKYAKILDKTYKKRHGKPVFTKGHAASDGRFFSKKNIPVILFGPVSIGHHSTDEKTEIRSVIKTYDVLDSYLSDL